MPETQGWSLPEKELFHLASCDLCVVLDMSKGAGEEIARYGAGRVAQKFFVLTPEKYRHVTTLPSAFRRHLSQEFFNDDEYDSCNLVQRVVARAQQVALAQLLRMAG
jgi:hypothetical protein